MDNVKQVVIETAKQKLQILNENISADITTKLEASAAPSNKSFQYLSGIIHKQKNLMVFGIAKNMHLQTSNQNVADLAVLSDEIFRDCSFKCSFSVRLRKPQENKDRPIKIILKSPVERDTTCHFLLSNLKLFQT